MGRLADLFDHHRDNVEEGVKKTFGKADDTLEALRKRLEEVEAKLREIAGEAPQSKTDKADNDVVTSASSSRTNDPANTSVAAEADESARRQTRTKR